MIEYLTLFFLIAVSTISEERDWGSSIAAGRVRTDADVSVPPFDDLRNYAYEGGGSSCSSLSSLMSGKDLFS